MLKNVVVAILVSCLVDFVEPRVEIVEVFVVCELLRSVGI